MPGRKAFSYRFQCLIADLLLLSPGYWVRNDLQDGGGVRCRDHLSPHKYIKTTSTCRTIPTEHLLNAGRRPQTSQKARKSPQTWVGQKKKGKTETKEKGWNLHLWEGAVKEENFPHTREPLHWQ